MHGPQSALCLLHHYAPQRQLTVDFELQAGGACPVRVEQHVVELKNIQEIFIIAARWKAVVLILVRDVSLIVERGY